MLGNDSTFYKQGQLIVYSLREAFISLIPYLIASSIGTLIFALLSQLHLVQDSRYIAQGEEILQNGLPILVLVTFAYQLAKLKHIDSAASVVLALTVLITLHPLSSMMAYQHGVASDLSALALLIPVVSTYALSAFINSPWLMSPQYASLDDSLRMVYRYTPAFILSLMISLVLIISLQHALQWGLARSAVVLSTLNVDANGLLAIRTLCSHLLTFIGVHGTNVYDLFITQPYLHEAISPNFTAKNVIDTFVIFGGVGACLALAIAVLIHAKDQHTVRITKIALPFLIFNVSEIIFYGLPVVLNRKLFIPFILVPMFNLGMALLVVHWGLFTFVNTTLPWITPIFINGYLATGGNGYAVMFQALLLGVDIVIYWLFVRTYVNTQCTTEHLSQLINKLNISSIIQAKRSVKFQEAQTFLVNAHLDTHHIIQLIIDNQLTVHYQPIVQMQHHTCHDFEALLRLRMQDGTVMNPDFLPSLERAGLSTVIDLWVCRQVRADFLAWQAEGYHPNISVNIHPDTFVDDESMKQIIMLLSGFNVQFEVIERALLTPEKSNQLIQQLKAHGFKVAIDDFGTGYSTLESLHHVSADTIKFDKKLIDATTNEKGYKIYYHISHMCNDLGFTLVAEGIETEAQMQLVQQMGIQYVQGWYFAPALSRVEAKQFADAFNLHNTSTAHSG